MSAQFSGCSEHWSRWADAFRAAGDEAANAVWFGHRLKKNVVGGQRVGTASA
jgi:hypothetical protein